MPLLNRAIIMATHAHAFQVDKGGAPYILHPLRLMMQMSDEDERIVALLHDVFEDTSITFAYAARQGFSKEVLTALEHITKKPGESYDAFIERCGQNKLASRVKLADLLDNMDLSRIPSPTEEDEARRKKYGEAHERLLDIYLRANKFK
jgi:(p)ppGpp synthase/HD superfamily hydrolase